MKSSGYALLWCGLLVAALLWAMRPGPPYVPPKGWRFWPEMGAVFDLRFERDGVLVGGKGGLFRLGPDGTIHPMVLVGFAAQPIIFSLARDGRDRLWIGHQDGLVLQDGAKQSRIDELNGQRIRDVRALLLARDGSLWIGAMGGLCRLPRSGVEDPVEGGEWVLPGARIMAMMQDSDGGLWVGTTTGLFLIQGDRRLSWSEKEGLPHPQVASLLQDSEGEVWVGTGFHDRGGTLVFRRSGSDWSIARAAPTAELAAPKTRSLFQDLEGRVWLGSETAGLTVRYKCSPLARFTTENGLPGQEVTLIRQSSDGAIWLGTLSGLIRIDGGALKAALPRP